MNQRINKTKIVKAVVLPYLQEKGYSYHYEQEMWIFTKFEGTLKKEIYVIDVHNEFLKIGFHTNAYGQKGVEGLPFVRKENFDVHRMGCCAYKNEEDFRAIICEFRRVIEEHSEEIFAEISEPTTEVIPTAELQKQLFDNHAELAMKGVEFLGIENKSGKDRIDAIVVRLEWTRETRTFQEVKEELVMLSATYGEMCRELSQGKWDYRLEHCWIEGKKAMIMSPLNYIFKAWDSGDYSNLYYDYELAERIHQQLLV